MGAGPPVSLMNALARLESADRLLQSRAGNACGLSKFRIFVRLRTKNRWEIAPREPI